MDPSQREVRTKLYFSYLHHVVFAPEAEQHSLLRSARAAKNMFEPYILFKLWDYNFAYVTTHTRTSRSWGARAGPHAALLPAPAAHSPHAPTPDPHHGPSDTRPAHMCAMPHGCCVRTPSLGVIAREPPSRPRSPGPSESVCAKTAKSRNRKC